MILITSKILFHFKQITLIEVTNKIFYFILNKLIQKLNEITINVGIDLQILSIY